MKKKDYKDQEEKEARLYPEINTGYEVLNEAGEWVVGRKKEPFTAYPREFVFSGIVGLLNGNTVKVLNTICSFTTRFRNTTVTDKIIMKYAGISKNTLNISLRELEFYHIISRHILPGGKPKKKRRCINIIRWDTALPLLVKEKKVVIGLDNKVTFPMPNPYRRK